VARFQDRAIVASHAYNTVIDLNGVKEVLKSDQLSVRPGVHFSFGSGGSAWHLMSGACLALLCFALRGVWRGGRDRSI
jgi:hypothetical protein